MWFIDIDPRTHTLDPSKIEQAITTRSKAIIPGTCTGSRRHGSIMEVASAAACSLSRMMPAHGATYKGRKVGGLGKLAASVLSTKSGAFGEAGACRHARPAVKERSTACGSSSGAWYHHKFVGW